MNERIERARAVRRRLAALELEERLRMTPQERQLADLRRNDHVYRPRLTEGRPTYDRSGGPRLSDE